MDLFAIVRLDKMLGELYRRGIGRIAGTPTVITVDQVQVKFGSAKHGIFNCENNIG
jgi:hypothetical protein